MSADVITRLIAERDAALLDASQARAERDAAKQHAEGSNTYAGQLANDCNRYMAERDAAVKRAEELAAELKKLREMDAARMAGYEAHERGVPMHENPDPHFGPDAHKGDAWDTGWLLGAGNRARAELSQLRERAEKSEAAHRAAEDDVQTQIKCAEAAEASAAAMQEAYIRSHKDGYLDFEPFERTGAGRALLDELRQLRDDNARLKAWISLVAFDCRHCGAEGMTECRSNCFAAGSSHERFRMWRGNFALLGRAELRIAELEAQLKERK